MERDKKHDFLGEEWLSKRGSGISSVEFQREYLGVPHREGPKPFNFSYYWPSGFIRVIDGVVYANPLAFMELGLKKGRWDWMEMAIMSEVEKQVAFVEAREIGWSLPVNLDYGNMLLSKYRGGRRSGRTMRMVCEAVVNFVVHDETPGDVEVRCHKESRQYVFRMIGDVLDHLGLVAEHRGNRYNDRAIYVTGLKNAILINPMAGPRSFDGSRRQDEPKLVFEDHYRGEPTLYGRRGIVDDLGVNIFK